MSNNTFTVSDVAYRVLNVTSEIQQEGNKQYAKAFQEATSSGVPLEIEMKQLLKSKGLFNQAEIDNKLQALRKEIKDQEILLRKGVVNGKRMTKDEARNVALSIKNLRSEILTIGQDVAKYLSDTAEGQAENRRFQYYLYACTVNDKNGERVWPTFEDFLKGEKHKEVLSEAISTFSAVFNGIDKDFEQKRYESMWLRKMGFVNEKNQLIRADGRPVDEDGRLIDEAGRFIDEGGSYVDIFGNPIDKDGNLMVEDTWGVLSKPATASTELAAPKAAN